MKKEMMVLIDSINDFESDFHSQSYEDQKQTTMGDFPDVDEYDLGYANGFSKAVYKTARLMASSESDFEELSDSISVNPLSIVTANSAFAVVDDDDDDIPEDIDKELDDLMDEEDEDE